MSCSCFSISCLFHHDKLFSLTLPGLKVLLQLGQDLTFSLPLLSLIHIQGHLLITPVRLLLKQKLELLNLLRVEDSLLRVLSDNVVEVLNLL